MSAPADPLSDSPAGAAELDALFSAISDAIEALVAWKITAFQSAVERQHAICDDLALHPAWRQLPGAAATARKVHDLNRVYDRLLQHSIHWTRIIRSIHQANGNPIPRGASVHFRG
jgi:hypothetical protein